MKVYSKVCLSAILAIVAMCCISGAADVAMAKSDRAGVLEEIIVTAQRREKPLQDLPVAVSVLGDVQLETLGIGSLEGLEGGAVPSLRVQPGGLVGSSLTLAIRGNGPTDIGQVTREGPVAVYMDGFYLSRNQGLSMELADLERIEVLRGPQGTLFGRNATSGAVSMISKKPTGTFGVEQTLGYGRFDELRSVTRVNLPTFSGISAKINYVHAERDGWVNNTAPGQADFNAYDKDALRISLNWQPRDDLEFDYGFDYADTSASVYYIQLGQDNIGIIGVEPGRQRQSRFPVAPLDPTVTEHKMHALTAAWDMSDNLMLKSLTSYRTLEEQTNTNFAGVLYFNGFLNLKDIEQDQWTQEVQLIGASERLDWIAGLYYFEEDAQEITEELFSLDIFGLLTGTPLTPIVPPTNFNVFTGASVPLRTLTAKARSKAIYGHANWTPPLLEDRVHIGAGLRYTSDERSGSRTDATTVTFSLDSEHIDPEISVTWDWSDSVSTYAKWSTAYKAGGVSPRSATLRPYQEEEVETFEIGLKSEFWDQRARFNAAIFTTDYDGLQINFSDPLNLTIIETINAVSAVEIDGLEFDLTLLPTSGLVVSASYTYLDASLPLQPNPLAGGALEQFALVQTPKHAGAVNLDYTFEPWSLGTLTAHLDVTSTGKSAFVAASIDERFWGDYTLVNARLTLADIGVGRKKGALRASLWAKNLADEEYIVFGFPIGPAGHTQVFGTPQTFGLDLTYSF